MQVNKRGVTLIELIGALALMGILIGLIASAIAIFIRSTNSSVTDSQVQTEGLLLVRTIESRINNTAPNRFEWDTCENANATNENEGCLRLIRDVDDPVESLEIFLSNDNQLFVGSNPLNIQNLLVSSAAIEVEEVAVNNTVIVNITIVLTLDPSDGRSFKFISSNLFRTD